MPSDTSLERRPKTSPSLLSTKSVPYTARPGQIDNASLVVSNSSKLPTLTNEGGR